MKLLIVGLLFVSGTCLAAPPGSIFIAEGMRYHLSGDHYQLICNMDMFTQAECTETALSICRSNDQEHRSFVYSEKISILGEKKGYSLNVVEIYCDPL